MNPGGNDAATIIGAAVAGTAQAPAGRSWFTDPLALLASVARAADQWEPPLSGGQAELLRPLAEAVASAPAASWWSGPLGGTVWTSRGNIGDLPAVGLACAEDPLGEEEFEVWAVGVDPAARVYEVHEPGDWGRLAAAHPRDVTASRRHDWGRWTGREGRPQVRTRPARRLAREDSEEPADRNARLSAAR